MIEKIKNFQRIHNTGIIAVVRGSSYEQAMQVVDAVKDGGIDVIEITLTVPGAIKVIEKLRANYSKNEILIGAGTVLDPETARIAILAGAEFIVSPSVNSDVIKLCNRYQLLSMPGCMTPTEVVRALEVGADVIKLFPGNLLGPSFVKSLKGPLPQAKFIPTGGVNLDNIQEWIKVGCPAVGVGGELTKGMIKGDFKQITATARRFIENIQLSRR